MQALLLVDPEGSAMIEIRYATSRDFRSLAMTSIRSWESAVVGWGEDTEALRANAHSAYQEFCTNQWAKIVVAHEGGVTLGWGAREKLDNNITDLWIDPEHQGKGAGKLLLATLEHSISDAGFVHSELETHARNFPALGFFEHCGYRVVALSVKYSDGLQQDIPIVTMRRDLEELPPLERTTI